MRVLDICGERRSELDCQQSGLDACSVRVCSLPLTAVPSDPAPVDWRKKQNVKKKQIKGFHNRNKNSPYPPFFLSNGPAK